MSASYGVLFWKNSKQLLFDFKQHIFSHWAAHEFNAVK